jgi:hypothetical protein
MDLSTIQQTLKAPKGQTNKFGNYKYRSCEDILEAVKPLLGDLSLTISDEVVEVGGRVYVKATATLFNAASEIIGRTTAFAREEESKKGMDASQLTGATSSYARKYSLNGLFCIDDTKDADTQDNRKSAPEPKMSVEDAIALINGASSLEALQKAFTGLPVSVRALPEVIAAKDAAKYDFTNNQ